LGIEGINKSLSDVASGLTDAARVVLVLDRVLEGRRTSIGRRGEALASVESAALPLADQRGPVGARSKAVAAHAAECFGPFGYIPVYQTSYPPRQVKNEAGSLDWQSRLSWPVARARFRDPTTWAAFSRYVPDVPEAARATLRNWLRHAQVLAPSPALLVRWRERRVDEARTISALTGLCSEATWWVPAEYAAPEPVPSRRIRPPGTPPSAGLRTLVMRAVGEHDEALTIYGPTPLPSKVFEGFNGRLSGETGLLPHDPSGLAFDLSPAPEWLRGLR
jgi:hypothetical protein